MIAFSLFGIDIHYYGLFYAISFILGFIYIGKLIKDGKHLKIFSKREFLEDIFLYIGLGVLFGGRLGYVLFYNLGYFIQNPIKIFYINEGGMAFVGAFIGVGLGLYILSRKYKISLFTVSDLVLSFVPFGLMLGRFGNYLNGELYGKQCPDFLLNTFLCKDYGNGYSQLSNQLLESFFEGFLLFIIMRFLVWKKGKLQDRGFITILFILYYTSFRFLLEFLRFHPDSFLYFGLSISQYFMILFFIFGLILLKYKRSGKTF